VARSAIPISENIVLSEQQAGSSNDSDSSRDESSDEFETNEKAGDDDDDDNDDDDDDEKNDAKNKKYKCSRCSNVYAYKSWLERHYNTVHKKMFACEFCPLSFKKKYQLQMHIQIYTGPKKHKCPKCQNTYNDKTNLTKHIQLKHNPNHVDFVCTRCQETFTCAKYLRYHVNTHNGLTPFKCNLCSCSFSSPAYLCNHKKKLHR